MPRKPRIEFAGAFYHVITRGNQRQKIFKETADYDKYRQILALYRNRYHFRLYAYVLMHNHVHLLLETGDTPLSKALQGVNQSYTLYFNRKYRTVGHLFQGRYKAILCDREAYILGLLKYIHENPVRARIADSIDGYKWSSHHAYTAKSNPLGLVSVDQVLRMFSENKGRARRKYLQFMRTEEAMTKSEVYATIDQRLKGDAEFVDRVLGEHEKMPARPWKRKIPLEKIAAAIEKRHDVSVETLRSPAKDRAAAGARMVFSILANDHGYKAVEIGRYLDKDPTRVTRYLQARDDVEKDVREAARLIKKAG